MKHVENIGVIIISFCITQDLDTAWKNIGEICSELIIES